MLAKKQSKSFDDRFLDQYPDLKEALKPNDQYPELQAIKTSSEDLPIGSFNTRVIINKGQVIERVYKTPNGELISLFPKPTNIFVEQVA